jgi:uncharacterized protein
MSHPLQLVICSGSEHLGLERELCELLAEPEFHLLVVGDGACALVERLCQDQGFHQDDSCRVHSLELPNSTKGGAPVLAAIAYGAELGFTHLVTTTAGCRQLRNALKVLAAAAEAHPLDVAAMARHSVTTPQDRTSRSLGRLLYGSLGPEASSLLRISRSDARLYPLIHVRDIPALSGRFDGEAELLTRLLWKGVAVRVVEADGDQSGRNVRESRYQRLKEDVRASFFTFVFVTVSLLRKHRTPAELSSSLGVGVFIGCTPFFGFHTMLAIVISSLCGLNVAYVWFGTQISNPLLAVFLTVLSVRVGRYVMGASAPTLGAFSLEWFVGSALVGSALAVLAGVSSYYVARGLSRKI